MSIGSRVRSLLGPRLEQTAANGYRRLFVSLDSLATRVAHLGPFETVIEVGCGEGALLTRLMHALDPRATALGIDIAPNPGHNYTGRNHHVEFRQATVAEVVAEGRRFDLVIVSDVLHHIPAAERREFLVACRDLLAPGGTVVVKEWVKRRNLAHAAAYTSDYWISGDKTVEFFNDDEMRALFVEVFGDINAVETTIAPHRNNLVLATRRH